MIMVGSYFQPGSHEAAVPVTTLSVVNGNVMLRTGTVEALNTALGNEGVQRQRNRKLDSVQILG